MRPNYIWYYMCNTNYICVTHIEYGTLFNIPFCQYYEIRVYIYTDTRPATTH